MSNAVPMLAGVGLLSVCCISSSFMSGAMGGEKTIEETATTTSDGSGGSNDCDVTKTDWISSKMKEDNWTQAQGEAAQKCKVPDNLKARLIAFCDVAKTDWINSKMGGDDWTQLQGEAAQKCKVPDNLQARITN